MTNEEENAYLTKPTHCRCPSCGTDHMMDIFWTGNLPAPKMCPTTCKKYAEKRNGPYMPYTSSGSRRSTTRTEE